jgi:hypothetical protein
MFVGHFVFRSGSLPPGDERGFGACCIVLDAIDGLPAEAGGLGSRSRLLRWSRFG